MVWSTRLVAAAGVNNCSRSFTKVPFNRSWVVLSVAATTISCSSADPGQESGIGWESSRSAITAPMFLVQPTCSNNINGFSKWRSAVDGGSAICGSFLRISSTTAPTIPLTTIKLATDKWNNAVLNYFGLPKFRDPTAPPVVGDEIVSVNFGNTSGDVTSFPSTVKYCGSATRTRPVTVTVHRANSSLPCGGGAQDPDSDFSHFVTIDKIVDLLVHELSHVIGMKGHIQQGGLVTTPAGHCSNSLVASGVINSGICQHERQSILWAYRIATEFPDYAKDIVTSVSVSPASQSLTSGQSQVFTANLVLDGGNVGGGGGIPLSPPLANEIFSWNVSDPSVLTLPPGITQPQVPITALATGSSTVGAVLTSSPRYAIGSPFNFPAVAPATVTVSGGGGGGGGGPVIPPPIPGVFLIQSFAIASCSSYAQAGKTYVTYAVTWTNYGVTGSAPLPQPIGYQISEGTATAGNASAVIRQGSYGVSSQSLGGYLVTPTAGPRYFWIRYPMSDGSFLSWIPLFENPVQISQGCLA